MIEKNLNPNNYNLVGLRWNIRSLMKNLNELKLLLNRLEKKNSPVDILLLCKMFLTKITSKLIAVPENIVYYMNRKDHKGGGTTILVRNSTTHKRRKDLETMIEKEVESTYVEITVKNGKHIVLGSVYKAPNTNESKL